MLPPQTIVTDAIMKYIMLEKLAYVLFWIFEYDAFFYLGDTGVIGVTQVSQVS